MHVGIIGAGAFGRALGGVIKKNATVIYVDAKDVLPSRRYDAIFLCVPVPVLRAVLTKYKDVLRGTCVVQSGKGISGKKLQLPIEMFREIVKPDHCNYAALMGPSFASEVGKKGQLTAFSVGDECGECFKKVRRLLRHPGIALERTTDPKALELAGALKNVYAVLFGYLEGAGYGENTRAAIFVRVLREYEDLMRAHRLSGDPLHFGVVGDFILCATSKTSRNYAFGYALASAAKKDIPKLLKGKTIEGYYSALAIRKDDRFGPSAALVRILVQKGKAARSSINRYVKSLTEFGK